MDRQGDHLRQWYGAPALIADPIVQSILAILLVSLIFLTLPGIDPWFTNLFYDDRAGFPMDRLPAFTALRAAGDLAVKALVIALIGAIVVKIARPWRAAPIRPSHVLYLLSALVVGPGLVVNVLFKENWGRPRPDATAAFGGDAPFTEVWDMTDHCLGNCSFVSGEASAAIWLVAAAILLPLAWRPRGRIILFFFAIFLSFNRIAFGRHFLSDVLMAWALTALVLAVMHRLIVEKPPAWLTNERMEAGLTQFGWRLRGKPAKETGE